MSEILIKNVACIIPGYSEQGEGQLISTEEILFHMQKQANSETTSREFDTAFIKKKTGINSVAFSQTTIDFVRKYWSSSSNYSSSEIFSDSQSMPNTSLYNMLEKVVKNCLTNLKNNDSDFHENKINYHIHITACLSTCIEPELLKIRQNNGIGLQVPIQTLVLQQGCSGLFTAFEVARVILAGSTAENILVTADNNMMISAHQRCQRTAGIDNINEWLWPAIFGEGVGAIIVGKQENQKSSGTLKRWGFSIDHLEQAIVEREWRVNHQYKNCEQTTSIYVKAREVSETYLKYIKHYAVQAIERSGGMDVLSRLCLHESNPRLIAIMKRELGISADDLIPSISSEVGTLACVSSFSLLALATQSLIKDIDNTLAIPKKSKIALALIGEAGGNIIAGNICLSLTNY